MSDYYVERIVRKKIRDALEFMNIELTFKKENSEYCLGISHNRCLYL